MGKGYRQGRLGEEIKRIVSDLIRKDLKDPRLRSELVSIPAVEVTSDGSYATVYVSVLDIAAAEANAEDVLSALQRAKGFIRKEIAGRVKLKHVPELRFQMDESQAYGRHIDQLIHSLSEKTGQEDEE